MPSGAANQSWFTAFINYLDPNAAGGDTWPNFAGGKMKSTGTSLWLSPNTNATNSSGFTGLPGGYRVSDGSIFYGIGETVYWWTFSQSNIINAVTRFLVYYAGAISVTTYDKKGGFPVRLIKD